MSELIVLMGVAGCGKTTVGQALAAELDCRFYDGDDYHPAANIARMSAGIPLEDGDRYPWLAALNRLLVEHERRGESAVMACSALKRDYRLRLGRGLSALRLVYLKGDFDLIWQRLQARAGHYMKAGMLQSQFEALEEPSRQEALWIDIKPAVPSLIAEILTHLAV